MENRDEWEEKGLRTMQEGQTYLEEIQPDDPGQEELFSHEPVETAKSVIDVITMQLIGVVAVIVVFIVVGMVSKPLFESLSGEYKKMAAEELDYSQFLSDISKEAFELVNGLKPLEGSSSSELDGKGGEPALQEADVPYEEYAEAMARIAEEEPVLPVSGRVTSSYGKREHPISKEEDYHHGTDIAAAQGTPILAFDDGVVLEASEGDQTGKYVKIQHKDGLVTRYLHCDALLVAQGDTVSKGQAIAKVGSTGMSTGYHLHFEILKDGYYLDPALLFDALKVEATDD